MSHTPGPWRWWATVCGARVAGHPADDSANFVCDVLIPERAVSFEANARLIAAAPVLLRTLQNIAQEDPGGFFAALALPAIRKATGEQA